jgi:hypothetical protein
MPTTPPRRQATNYVPLGYRSTRTHVFLQRGPEGWTSCTQNTVYLYSILHGNLRAPSPGGVGKRNSLDQRIVSWTRKYGIDWTAGKTRKFMGCRARGRYRAPYRRGCVREGERRLATHKGHSLLPKAATQMHLAHVDCHRFRCF